jgi:SAM-dependent methyltransferase
MSVDAERTCPGCGSPSDEVVYSLPTPILRCSSCGLIFEAAGGDTAHLYNDDYFHGSGYTNYPARERQWHREARTRLRWIKRCGAGRRLLEVGCAAGFFLDEARRDGFECLGVELASGMAAYGREKLGLSVIEGEFEEVSLPADSFDVICAWHVLEHVSDPYAFLTKVEQVLAPDGILALEVPNIASRTANRTRVKWDCLQPGFHRLHFSPASLTWVLEKAGFEIVSLETLWQAAYVPWQERLRPLRLARRAARALQLRRIGLTHPTQGDFVRAIARFGVNAGPRSLEIEV